jgi:ribosome-associated heat shock protein Hsp15
MDKEHKIRLDQYLWAIRIFKTRGVAKTAIDEGKVRLKGEITKPSKMVHVGDVYNVRTSDKRQSIQVKSLISKRVAYSLAIENYYDVSTPEENDFAKNKLSSSFFTGKRQSKTGKPTKKQTREISEFYSADSVLSDDAESVDTENPLAHEFDENAEASQNDKPETA